MNSTQRSGTAPYGCTGVAQVDDALDRLAHVDRNVRQAAALILGELSESAAAPDLIARLWAEHDPFVRETITWAIVRVASAATPLLLEALTHADAATLDRALHALSKIAEPSTVDAIIPLTANSDPVVAAKARWALTRIGDPRAIPILAAYLGEGDETTRNGVTRDLAPFGATAVPALIGALTSTDVDVRRHAAEVLCFMGAGADSATEALSKALDDPDGDVRVSVAMALFDLRTPQALAALTRHTAIPDKRVRAIADRAIRRSGGR